jgi:hypothetical protein
VGEPPSPRGGSPTGHLVMGTSAPVVGLLAKYSQVSRRGLRTWANAEFSIEAPTELAEKLQRRDLLPGGCQRRHQLGMRLFVQGLALAQPPQAGKGSLVAGDRRRGACEAQHGLSMVAGDLGDRWVITQQVNVFQHLAAPHSERSLVQATGEAVVPPGNGQMGAAGQSSELRQVQLDRVA